MTLNHLESLFLAFRSPEHPRVFVPQPLIGKFHFFAELLTFFSERHHILQCFWTISVCLHDSFTTSDIFTLFFTPSPRGPDISDQLELVAQVVRPGRRDSNHFPSFLDPSLTVDPKCYLNCSQGLDVRNDSQRYKKKPSAAVDPFNSSGDRRYS